MRAISGSIQSNSVDNNAAGEVTATITSAVALTNEEKKNISTILSQLIGREVTLSVHLNERLLGGMKIEVEDWSIDTSIHRQLLELATKLKES